VLAGPVLALRGPGLPHRSRGYAARHAEEELRNLKIGGIGPTRDRYLASLTSRVTSGECGASAQRRSGARSGLPRRLVLA